MQDFYFNGHWLSEFGGRLTDNPSINISKRQFKVIEIPGKSKSSYIDKGYYSNVDFNLSIAIIANYNGLKSNQLINNLIHWLAYANGYCEYRDTQHPKMFTTAYLTNFDNIVRELNLFSKTTIKFSREAFWYSDIGKAEKTYIADDIISGIEIINPYPILSKPTVSIDFSNSVSVSKKLQIIINDDVLSCTPYLETEKMVIDFDNMEAVCYDSDTKKLLYFPFDIDLGLYEGKNTISIKRATGDNDIQSVSITPNWRCL